jgi:hypothetical protein
VFCCKSAEIYEKKGDEVFALAKERAERAKETGWKAVLPGGRSAQQWGVELAGDDGR